MDIEGNRIAWIGAVGMGIAASTMGCALGQKPMLDWRAVSLTVDNYPRGEDVAIPSMTEWKGPFRTNIFSLSVMPVGTDGWILELENLTRYPIEFDWRRTLLVDSWGWTHPLIYPRAARTAGYRSESNLPIMVAPYAKRRIALLSRVILCPDEFPFRPDVGSGEHLRPGPSTIEGRLEEQIMLILRFRDEELAYRLAIKFEADAPQQSRRSSDDSKIPEGAPTQPE